MKNNAPILNTMKTIFKTIKYPYPSFDKILIGISDIPKPTINVKNHKLATHIPKPTSGKISAIQIHVIGPKDIPKPNKKIPINATLSQD